MCCSPDGAVAQSPGHTWGIMMFTANRCALTSALILALAATSTTAQAQAPAEPMPAQTATDEVAADDSTKLEAVTVTAQMIDQRAHPGEDTLASLQARRVTSGRTGS